MVEEGADILDVGGESTRPGHEPVSIAEETARVVPVIAAIHAALPEIPISVDTAKAQVAAAALDAGAVLLNDVWVSGATNAMARLAASDRSDDRDAQPRRGSIRRLRGRAPRRPASRPRSRYEGRRPAREPDRRPGLRLRQDARAQPGGAAPPRRAARAGFPRPPGHLAQVDLGRVLGRSSARRAPRGDPGHHRSGHRRGVDIVPSTNVLANVRAARMADAVVRGGGAR